MKISPRSSMAIVSLLLASSLQFSHAQIYKWVDAQGKTHYSDKGPAEGGTTPTKVETSSNSRQASVGMPVIATGSPIINSPGQDTKSVILEHVSLEVEGVEMGDNPVVGESFKYTQEAYLEAENLYRSEDIKLPTLSCLPDGKLKLKNAGYILKQSDVQRPFFETFNSNGYSVVGAAKPKFSLQDNKSGDISLAAVITEIKLVNCGPAEALTLSFPTQNSTYLKVQWEVFDNLARKVVYSTTTEGVDDSIYKSPRANGAPLSLGLAFRQATEQLLTQPAFIDILKFDNGATATGSVSDDSVTKSFQLSYGKSNSTFTNRIADIQKASATIRTNTGHGSGFIISADGYVLTNYHVVGVGREFLVIIEEQKYKASLIRSDAKRDVALLKINAYSGPYLNISPDPIGLGSTIYVVGTPLSEALGFSITQGILSANRKIDGQDYFQTDAAVSPGNSGGPAFNEFGNVIGITVSGYFTQDGASKNINYLIPISDALAVLNLK